MTHEHPTEPVYPFGPPGAEVLLHRGAMAVGDVHGTGRVWMHMTGSLDHRWELDPDAFSSVQMDDARLTFVHAALGPVDLPVRVTSSAGRGIVLPTAVGGASALHEVVVHWVNVPSIYPAGALASDWGSWAGRWTGSGGGWSLVLDARHDHTAVLAEAEDTPFHVVTHTGVLRRTDGQAFAPKQAEDALFGWQTMLSFALGRWVAPALAVGSADGARVWELWSPWRCDTFRSSEAWWDTHQSDDLATFATQFLGAWTDPDRHDSTRHVAHHMIESNEPATTLEARIMLVGAALEYLSWVTHVLSGLRSAGEHGKRSAAENLRELLSEAGITADGPADLGVVERLRVEKLRQDGPEAVAWVRNRLVHPKDVKEPYELAHLVLQTWQLLMQYGELLLLRHVGYTGSFCGRFPPGRWAHDSAPVPWAAQNSPPAKCG